MKISVHQSSQCSFLPSNFFSRGVSSKAGGRTWMVGVSILKVHGYFEFHVYRHRMQPTFTANYFLEGGFPCYCKMAALTVIVCVPTGLCVCLPWVRVTSGLSEAKEKENKLIWQAESDHWYFMQFLHFSMSDKGAEHSKTLTKLPSSKT